MVSKNTKKSASDAPVALNWQGLLGYDTLLGKVDTLVANEHLPACLLIEGRVGLGKRHFAAAVLARLYCEHADACGSCGDCMQLKKMQHPDVLWVDADAPTIKRDEADAIGEHLSLCGGSTAFVSGRRAYRAAVIIDAERLSAAAAARLLKTLEELPAGAIVLMTSGNYRQIPNTIRSRAVRLHVTPPTPEQAKLILHELLAERGLNAGQDLLNAAVYRSGCAPGAAVDLCAAMLADTSLGADLARLLDAQSGEEVLRGAEDLCKSRGQSLAVIVKEVEILLNRGYVKGLASEVEANLGVGAMRRRREILSRLRHFAVQQKIALNPQLAVDALMSAGKN